MLKGKALCVQGSTSCNIMKSGLKFDMGLSTVGSSPPGIEDPKGVFLTQNPSIHSHSDDGFSSDGYCEL